MDLKLVKRDLLKGIRECSQRGLSNSVKWLSELNYSINNIKLSPQEYCDINQESYEELEEYLLAKSYFDLKEYDRCAYFTEHCITERAHFLHLYSRYLSIEKKKLDNVTDLNCPPDPSKNSALRELSTILKSDYYSKPLDGYCLYLYGVILKKLDLAALAIDIFVEAINKNPLHWGAWQELAFLIPDKSKLEAVAVPDHWMKQFFLAHAYLEHEEALQMYHNLLSQGFEKSTYLMAQMAIACHNQREVDKAIDSFKQLLAVDPYRLDNLDIYSNLLYVKDMKIELADLAHSAVNVDKYRVETCCVIGNYYSLRSDHPKAVLYFQRALKLNPHYLSAWTLMGHEFMEMKNTNAAIQSYRQAIEVNRRDYRAWYGLGQTYEILKMPFYCMYYYKQAQQLRPNDSRMIIALGETYEKLDKIENALKCYYKACNVGDIEGMALLRLAKLYDKLKEVDNAAAAYTEYCLKEDEHKIGLCDEQSEFYNAFHYLANYHLKKGRLDDAYTYAYKCLEYNETKDQAKALLKAIAARRGEQDIESVPMDETSASISNIANEASTSNVDMVFSPTL